MIVALPADWKTQAYPKVDEMAFAMRVFTLVDSKLAAIFSNLGRS